MQFGEWVRKVRDERGLDLRLFAEMTGVDSSTISRTENLQTQTTLYTAFRIAEGMGFSLQDLIQVLEEKHLSGLEEKKPADNSDILTLKKVEERVNEFYYNKDRRGEISKNLARDLNNILEELGSGRKTDYPYINETTPYSKSDINRILFRSPLTYRPDLRYPPVAPTVILSAHQQDGVLMPHDVEAYLSRIHRGGPRFALVPLGHVGTGSWLERIKFSDVLQFDAEAKQDGKVIGMYWEACRFYVKFTDLQKHYNGDQLPLFDVPDVRRSVNRSDEWVIRLALLLVTIYRWQQYLRDKDYSQSTLWRI